MASMEADSDAENQNKSNESKKFLHNNNEGQQGKPKRQMKTPFQLETLEKAYALETYPSEATRAELSEKLGLSDRQLQMWFCHRRLKDKKEKENPPKKMRKNVAVVLPESPIDELRTGAEAGSDYGSGSGSGSSPYMMEMRNAGGSSRGIVDDMPVVRRSYESQQSIMELRAIACVEAQLGEPLREDGPVLGMEFDSLPPGAFGAPIASSDQQKRSAHPYESKIYDRHDAKSNKVIARALHEYQSLPEQPYFHGSPLDGSRARMSFAHGNESFSRVHGVQGHVSRVRVLSQQDKPGHIFQSPNGGEDSLPQRESTSNNRINAHSAGHPIFGTEDPYLLSDGQTFNDDADVRMERKRKIDEARIAREAEAHEIRMRKELERQDVLRRKSEERMRKEMEKHERERRREEEKLIRERQREEERSLREQRREMERREKFLQKEYLRAEKRRLKEELRMEKQAAKRKVALEKATARKMAKESMDLIEDEQLELMELAAASKGISSIIHLDLDTLQNLDLFRDSLSVFPPKSVQLKRPFAVQPWIDSEENIGNLLMVWRFFITFADILGLWPFTLDEFVQAFHDYDSRLLCEIHVAVLKSIIKDIEDVARTPSSGLGMNQYCAANPEGGHPRIIEGAYAWGFDIRNWQRHLNPLTWPEIFRQLALSAGFGPKLKKRSSTWANLGDNHEGKGCEDIVSTIRNGSAAENAFAWMREKGLLLPRRSRHKLTPGTVKFAAFHVLSLEGSKGLTVLELAEKIQKSGLRDLTTSKTPEASISVALTRDTKLFERIAPSTYCVRLAFRKDPADADAVLSAARKKIRIFENGFLAGEDADDVERDEDSECDVDEDPEIEDLATPSTAKKTVDRYDEANTCSVSGKENVCNDTAVSVPNDADKGFSSFSLNGSKDTSCQSTAELYVAGEDIGSSNLNQENTEIDESKPGESWIQGLSEGDYSHLSVEERLNALVALIGVANEGNSIRAVLEDRLEAANALKKQMWAEAQLDKSRLKEDNMTRLDFTTAMGGKSEAHVAGSAVEGSQSPLPVIVDNKHEASPTLTEEQKPLFSSQVVQNHPNDFPSERTLAVQDFSTGLDNLTTQQHGPTSKRLRSQLKAYIAHMAEEMYVYRSLPLGQDRRRNRYWQFATSASRNDPCSGRIFVELHDGTWRLIDTEEAFDALLSSLDTRGVRESHLRIMLQKIETSFKENGKRSLQRTNTFGQSGATVKNEAVEMDADSDFASSDSPSSAVCGLYSDTHEISSSFRIELGKNEIEKKSALERYQEFQWWMWKECLNSSLYALKIEKTRCMQLLAICDGCLDSHLSEDSHCPSCHQTFAAVKNFKFSEHAILCEEKRKLGQRDVHVFDSPLPLGIRLLKTLSAVIEASIPPEALEAFWTEEHRRTWGMRLNASSGVEEVLQILTILESGIRRQYLSSNFETTKELLGTSIMSADPLSVPTLPWIPKTIAAVALRLLELDASIMYVKPEKPEPFEDKELNESVKLPSRDYLPLKNKEIELKELDQDGYMKEENYSNLAVKRKNYKRGKGNRDQGWSRKYQKRTPSITANSGRRKAKNHENLNPGPKQQGLRTNGQGHGRGRRTARRRAERRPMNETFQSQMTDVAIARSSREFQRSLDEEEWGVEKVRTTNMEDAEESNSAEAVDSDDNAQGEEYEQGNWEVGFSGASNGWNRDMNHMVEVSDDEDASGDEAGIEEVADEDSEGNLEMSEASDQNGMDDGMDSAASEYSD